MKKIIDYFKLSYLLISLIAVGLIISFIYTKLDPMIYYEIGKKFGQMALISYILTLIPGMFNRLDIKNKYINIIRIYRRYIGILMYVLTMAHLIIIKLTLVYTVADLLPQNLYQWMGTIAFLFLLKLFITSNNKSVQKLRLNWFRIQRLTYIAMFFVFLHVAFIRFGIFSLIMGLVLILQTISFIAVYKRTKSFTGGKPY